MSVVLIEYYHIKLTEKPVLMYNFQVQEKEAIMKVLAESVKYVIFYEYEKVFLYIKENDKRVLIGEFYGDPYIAVISYDESFCVIGGEGIIVYYLKEPFEEFRTSADISSQWKTWGRDDGETVWIDEIHQIDNQHIEIVTENSEKTVIDV